MDAAFEQETDAAFAALQSADATPPASPADSAGSMWEEEKTRASATLDSELPDVDVEETGTPFADLFQNQLARPRPSHPTPTT
jgi:hypothetical protein